MNSKSLEYYMQLPYKVEIFPDEEGAGYSAIVPELPGCMTAAADFSELYSLVEEVKRLWLEVALSHGDHIPEPMPEETKDFSGKFLVRVPKSLHRQLSKRAEIDDTSLNQLVVALLADSMGRWTASSDQDTSIRSKFRLVDTNIAVTLSTIYELSRTHHVEKEMHSWSTDSLKLPAKLTEVNPI